MKNLEQMITALKKFRVAAIGGTTKTLNSFFVAEGVRKHKTSAEIFNLLKEENFIVTDSDFVYWRPELMLSDEIAKDLIERAYACMRKKQIVKTEKSVVTVLTLGQMIQRKKELEAELQDLTSEINVKVSEFLSSESITLEDLIAICK